MVKENTFVHLEAFMVNDLGLSGNELITYAVIYGFSQDGNTWFTGSRKYIADWCGCIKSTVSNCLKKLIQKGYIERRERVTNGVTLADYRATINVPGCENSSGGIPKFDRGGVQNFCPHTIDIDTIEDTNKCAVSEKHAPNIPKSYETTEMASRIIDYLNEKAGKRYRHSKTAITPIIARLKDGYTEEALKKIIDCMVKKWQGTQMEEYLRPSTLFRASNCENYEQMAMSTQETKKPRTFADFDAIYEESKRREAAGGDIYDY